MHSYQFSYLEMNSSYYVEICKFFFNDNSVYMSLAPVSEDEKIEIDDGKWVLAKDVEGFILS